MAMARAAGRRSSAGSAVILNSGLRVHKGFMVLGFRGLEFMVWGLELKFQGGVWVGL